MILVWLQAALALIAIVLIILQQPSDDQAGKQSFFSPQVVRRGWEKITFVVTLVSGFAFLAISLARLVIEGK